LMRSDMESPWLIARFRVADLGPMGRAVASL
jgi:hypothetical protein